MQLIKLLLFTLLTLERNLNLSKSYLELNNPKAALQILEQTPSEAVNDEQLYQLELLKAQSFIELNEPLKGLAILQKLHFTQGLTPNDNKTIFDLISFAFLKMQQPRRASYFSQQAKVREESLPQVTPITSWPDNPFDKAILLQTHAMERTIALPFFTKNINTQTVEAQKSVQQVREPFVNLLYEQQQNLGPNCIAEEYQKITAPFYEGLQLALVAEKRLLASQLTFAEIIPIQREAIDKFKEAKNRFLNLPPPSSSSSAEAPLTDLKNLRNMLEDEKRNNTKPVPANTNKVIW